MSSKLTNSESESDTSVLSGHGVFASVAIAVLDEDSNGDHDGDLLTPLSLRLITSSPSLLESGTSSLTTLIITGDPAGDTEGGSTVSAIFYGKENTKRAPPKNITWFQCATHVRACPTSSFGHEAYRLSWSCLLSFLHAIPIYPF